MNETKDSSFEIVMTIVIVLVVIAAISYVVEMIKGYPL